MKGIEALRILNQVRQIRDYLLEDEDRLAFYRIGILSEEMAQIIRVDEVTFNPSLNKDDQLG
jgi:hypothetical protein